MQEMLEMIFNNQLKAKISSTTHVQMLQWLHGKQQQQLDCWAHWC